MRGARLSPQSSAPGLNLALISSPVSSSATARGGYVMDGEVIFVDLDPE